MKLTINQEFELEKARRNLDKLTNEQLKEVLYETLKQNMMLRNFWKDKDKI